MISLELMISLRNLFNWLNFHCFRTRKWRWSRNGRPDCWGSWGKTLRKSVARTLCSPSRARNLPCASSPTPTRRERCDGSTVFVKRTRWQLFILLANIYGSKLIKYTEWNGDCKKNLSSTGAMRLLQLRSGSCTTERRHVGVLHVKQNWDVFSLYLSRFIAPFSGNNKAAARGN